MFSGVTQEINWYLHFCLMENQYLAILLIGKFLFACRKKKNAMNLKSLPIATALMTMWSQVGRQSDCQDRIRIPAQESRRRGHSFLVVE